MNVDFLYELNSLQAARIILDILDNFNHNYKKNLEILKKLMVFLEDRDFKNPYSSIIGSLANVKRIEENKENIADASYYKNLLKLKQYVYDRCQIAYIANKMALGYKETKFYNLNKYIEYLPIKGELLEKLYNLDNDKIKIYKKIRELFKPIDKGFKINIIDGIKTRKTSLRKYLIKNQITINIIGLVYCNFDDYIEELSKDIFKYYIFLSKAEREKSKLFPGIAKVPDIETLNFLKIDGIKDPVKLIEMKIIKENIIKHENPFIFGVKFLYENNVDPNLIAKLCECEVEEIKKIIDKSIAKTDRAKQFLDELL